MRSTEKGVTVRRPPGKDGDPKRTSAGSVPGDKGSSLLPLERKMETFRRSLGAGSLEQGSDRKPHEGTRESLVPRGKPTTSEQRQEASVMGGSA